MSAANTQCTAPGCDGKMVPVEKSDPLLTLDWHCCDKCGLRACTGPSKKDGAQ